MPDRLNEIHHRHARKPGARRRRTRRCRRRGKRLLHERLHVLVRDAVLEARALYPREVDAELAGQATDRRAGVRPRKAHRLDRRCQSRLHLRRPGGGTGHDGRNRRLGDGWRRRRGSSLRRGPGHLDLCNQRALADSGAGLHVQSRDASGDRRGNVHRRLLRLKREERAVDEHVVTDLYRHVDDGHVLEITEVWHDDGHEARGRRGGGRAAGRRSRSSSRSSSRRRSRHRRRAHRRGGRGDGGRRGAGLQFDHDRAHRHPIALLHEERHDRAGRRARNVHGRLLRLKRDERGLRRNHVAHLDEHVDDLDVLEITNVRNANGKSVCHGVRPSPGSAWRDRSRTSSSRRGPSRRRSCRRPPVP